MSTNNAVLSWVSLVVVGFGGGCVMEEGVAKKVREGLGAEWRKELAAELVKQVREGDIARLQILDGTVMIQEKDANGKFSDVACIEEKFEFVKGGAAIRAKVMDNDDKADPHFPIPGWGDNGAYRAISVQPGACNSSMFSTSTPDVLLKLDPNNSGSTTVSDAPNKATLRAFSVAGSTQTVAFACAAAGSGAITELYFRPAGAPSPLSGVTMNVAAPAQVGEGTALACAAANAAAIAKGLAAANVFGQGIAVDYYTFTL